MEGPSLVILRETLKPFKNKKVIAIAGASKIDQHRLQDKTIVDFKTWGKHFLIVFKGFFVRIHFLMFGSYRIDEQKPSRLSLGLDFANGQQLNFYTCAIKMFDGHPADVYDWRVDVMSDSWDASKCRRSLKKQPDTLICDALLDQEIFAGVGNIIKNEVLFRIKMHPETLAGKIPPRKMTELINEARNYSFDFYEWKKLFVLKKHWLIYGKRVCPRCKIPVVRTPTGKNPRQSFYCENCQVRYK